MSEKKKSIGYHAPQYHNAKEYGECRHIEKINAVMMEFSLKAIKTERPDWYVKGAELFFTYEDEYYVIYPSDLGTSSEVFDRLSRDLEDALYEAGAYDMFYGGMMD